MSLTPSNMLPLGTPLPVFALPEPSGKVHTDQSVRGVKGTLVAILCNHCPYVKHLADGLSRVADTLIASGIGVVGINGNDAVKYPADSPAKMAEEAALRHYSFPYLYDGTQTVVTALQGACTPEFYLFDARGNLYYRGQFDGSRPGNAVPVNGQDLTRAAQLMLGGQPPPLSQMPSMGCNIKWLPGNGPNRRL